MDYKDLKQYIKNIYELEVSLYNQEIFLQNIRQEMQILNNVKGEKLIQEETIDPTSSAELGCGTGFISCLIVAIVFIGINIYNDFRNFHSFSEFLGILFVLEIIVFAITAVISQTWDYHSENRRIKYKNNQIREKNERIKEKNIENKKQISTKLDVYNNEYMYQKNIYSYTRDLLNRYYNKEIIFPKYRNIIAISSFYEYFVSGRCNTLEGHEGAYNLYENELRQNIIIGKLDEVIVHLERIEDNQYMLYSAIKDGNAQINTLMQEMKKTVNLLENIDSNSAITAYNSKVVMANTEFLAWIETYKEIK